MAGIANRVLLASFALIAAGVAWAAIGNLSQWGVNAAGLAPSALVGFVLITLGSLGLWCARLVRTGAHVWLILPAILAALGIGAVGAMLVDEARPMDYAEGLRGPAGYLVIAGYLVCYATVSITLTLAVLAAGMFALSWVLDLVPPLRRRGAGASIRGDWRSPFRDGR